MGLLRTAATVAVASSVHGRVQRRQQNRWAAQTQSAAVPVPQPPAPVAAAPPAPAPQAPAAQPNDMGERLAQLTQLGELMNAGVLTEAEFQQQKTRILSG